MKQQVVDMFIDIRKRLDTVNQNLKNSNLKPTLPKSYHSMKIENL